MLHFSFSSDFAISETAKMHVSFNFVKPIHQLCCAQSNTKGKEHATKIAKPARVVSELETWNPIRAACHNISEH